MQGKTSLRWAYVRFATFSDYTSHKPLHRFAAMLNRFSTSQTTAQILIKFGSYMHLSKVSKVFFKSRLYGIENEAGFLLYQASIFSRQASLARQAFLITPLHGARYKTGKNAYAKK